MGASMRKLTPEMMQTIQRHIDKYQECIQKSKLQKYASSEWFAIMSEAHSCYRILAAVTGLSMRQMDLLVTGATTVEDSWNHDGSRKIVKKPKND